MMCTIDLRANILYPVPPNTITKINRYKKYIYINLLSYVLVHLRKAILRPLAYTPRSSPNLRQSRTTVRTLDRLSAGQTNTPKNVIFLLQ